MSKITTLYEFKPNWAVRPGEIVAEYIQYYGWSQREFAHRLGLHENTVSNIIKSKDKITPEIAEKFARVFGMKTSFFINLQALYDESLPRQIKSEELEKEKGILEKLPYLEMVKLGWVAKTQKIEEKLKNLYGYFAIASLSSLLKVGVGEIAYRKNEKRNFSPETLAIWLRKGEIESLNLEIPEFDKKKLENSLEKVKRLTLKSFDEIKQELKEILFECGVILCYTPKLTNSCVNGASRWYGNNILIQISDSGKKEDIFWFTLFHEIGHVLKHLYNAKKKSFIDMEDEEKSEFEIEADDFAKDVLIPKANYSELIKNMLNESAIKKFSLKERVDIGVLVGRLCNDKYMNFSQADRFRKKIKF
jgi:HTH-type transcriptional regulator/antitoxin HigA